MSNKKVYILQRSNKLDSPMIFSSFKKGLQHYRWTLNNLYKDGAELQEHVANKTYHFAYGRDGNGKSYEVSICATDLF